MVLLFVILNQLSSSNKLNRENLFIITYFFAIGFWLISQTPLASREASVSGIPANIKSSLAKDPNYLNEEILYLCFGTKAYDLGMKNSNRYFYSLAMLRHHQLTKVANATKGEMRYISRYGAEMAKKISESEPLIGTLNGALAFSGKYILFDKKGWCQRDLYPKLDSLISTNYTILEDSKYETLFIKNYEGSN